MKKFLKIIGFIAGGILLIALVMEWDSFMDFTHVRQETSRFADEAANIIATGNNAKFKERAHPALLYMFHNPDHGLDDYFKLIERLGKPKAAISCLLDKVTVSSDRTMAVYQCSGEYENGPLAMAIRLRRDKEGSAWTIYAFKIESPYFATLIRR